MIVCMYKILCFLVLLFVLPCYIMMDRHPIISFLLWILLLLLLLFAFQNFVVFNIYNVVINNWRWFKKWTSLSIAIIIKLIGLGVFCSVFERSPHQNQIPSEFFCLFVWIRYFRYFRLLVPYVRTIQEIGTERSRSSFTYHRVCDRSGFGLFVGTWNQRSLEKEKEISDNNYYVLLLIIITLPSIIHACFRDKAS